MARRECLEQIIEETPVLEESIVYCGRSFKVRFPYGEFAERLLRKDALYQKLGLENGEIEKTGEIIRDYWRKAEDVMQDLKTGFIMLNADDEGIFFPIPINTLSFARKGNRCFIYSSDRNSGLFFEVIFGGFSEVIFQKPELEMVMFSLFSPLEQSPLFLKRDNFSQNELAFSLVISDMGSILEYIHQTEKEGSYFVDLGHITKMRITPFVEGVVWQ